MNPEVIPNLEKKVKKVLTTVRMKQDGLSASEIEFAERFVFNGENSLLAAQEAQIPNAEECHGSLVVEPHVMQYIHQVKKHLIAAKTVTYNYKLTLLKKMAEAIIGDEFAGAPAKNAEALVRVISEMNKMQGHYAPTQVVSQNVDYSHGGYNNVIEVMPEVVLIEKYEKEF